MELERKICRDVVCTAPKDEEGVSPSAGLALAGFSSFCFVSASHSSHGRRFSLSSTDISVKPNKLVEICFFELDLGS